MGIKGPNANLNSISAAVPFDFQGKIMAFIPSPGERQCEKGIIEIIGILTLERFIFFEHRRKQFDYFRYQNLEVLRYISNV